MTQRYCRDCAHYRIGDWAPGDKCAHPGLIEKREPIRGDPSPHYCNMLRLDGSACGPDARLFEAKRG